jgi:hypothetical protein
VAKLRSLRVASMLCQPGIAGLADGSGRAFRRGRAFSSGADVYQRQLCKLEEFGQHGCLTGATTRPAGWLI